MMLNSQITLSIVSHGQSSFVEKLLSDIDQSGAGQYLKEVIVTNNIPEVQNFKLVSAPLKVIAYQTPKGFGENHNASFVQCTSAFFCVVNPDIRLHMNPLPALLERIKAENLGVIGPKVVNQQGELEDSARPFPSFSRIIKKGLGNQSAALYPYNIAPESPDWIAGMFMLFDSKAFAEVGGFDERYFLYYEDADICARLKLAGWGIGYCKDVEVIHDARRDSHKKLRYFKWHVSSMLRFFIHSVCRSIFRRL